MLSEAPESGERAADAIARWLIDEARLTAAPLDLIEGFCRRLVDRGVPLWRLRVGQRLANPLASAWGGRPHWFFHPMGLGEPIGVAAKLSQNNRSLYAGQNFGTRYTHVTLLGDPSLRMHPVIPPASVAVNDSSASASAASM